MNMAGKILVVDDMMTMRKLIVKSLKEIGFTDFEEAPDGAQAWEKFASGNFAIVISDWNMPNCTGLDFLKRVRADSRFKTIPFYLVTAESEKAQVVEALKAGVTGYIVKPFDTETLRNKLQETSKAA